MTNNFLNSIPMVLTGSRAAVDKAVSRLPGLAHTAIQEYETVATDGRIVLGYRLPLGRSYESWGSNDWWSHWAGQVADDIDELAICIDRCDVDLVWERLEIHGASFKALSSYPLPLYPRAFSLYADSCSDIEELAERAGEIFTALSDLTDDVSLLDDYADVFPEYEDIGTIESLEESDDWDGEDWAREDARAQAEEDYGGWWLTWKTDDESNIEKLHSGKLLIGLIGKLCNAGYADFVMPSEHRMLLDWIPDFLSLVDKHELWYEDDDIQSIRLAVAWCEETKMRITL